MAKTNVKASTRARSKRGLQLQPRSIPELPLKTNRLDVQFSIIVPSTKFDKDISARSFMKRVEDERTFLDNIFGGDSSIEQTGGFVSETGKLISEKNVMVTVSMSANTYRKNRRMLARHIQEMQRKWDQESIGYGVEGSFFLFPRSSFIPSDTPRMIAVE